jgi:hypothetical protein
MKKFRYWLVRRLLNDGEKVVLHRCINERVKHLSEQKVLYFNDCHSDMVELDIFKNDLWD